MSTIVRPAAPAPTASIVSHDLQPGARYNYTIRAEFVRDGKTVTEDKTLQLAAGQTAGLDFTRRTRGSADRQR